VGLWVVVNIRRPTGMDSRGRLSPHETLAIGAGIFLQPVLGGRTSNLPSIRKL
jgi:hypothetical protein